MSKRLGGIIDCKYNIGAPWGYCGQGFIFPIDYGSVGVQLTRLCRLNQGTLTSICVRKNLNATVLQVTCTREFFFNSCTGISMRGKTCPYSTAVVVLIFCIWRYFIPIVGVGKIYGRRRGHREQSRE